MRKYITSTVFALVALGLSTLASATSLKVGVIDLHHIIEKSTQVKAINKELRATFKPRQSKILSAQKALEKEVTKLKRDSAIMSNTEKSKLQEQILSDRRSLQRQEQDYQQDLTRTQNAKMQKFFAKLKKTVEAYAAASHYDLILQKDNIPYASNHVDITQQILEKLS